MTPVDALMVAVPLDGAVTIEYVGEVTPTAAGTAMGSATGVADAGAVVNEVLETVGLTVIVLAADWAAPLAAVIPPPLTTAVTSCAPADVPTTGRARLGSESPGSSVAVGV